MTAAESRKAQGLPEKVEDPIILARIAAIIVAAVVGKEQKTA